MLKMLYLVLEHLLEVRKMSAQLDNLLAVVTRNESLMQSMFALTAGLSKQLKDAKNDPEAVQSIADRLSSDNEKIAQALVANTGAADVAPETPQDTSAADAKAELSKDQAPSTDSPQPGGVVDTAETPQSTGGPVDVLSTPAYEVPGNPTPTGPGTVQASEPGNSSVANTDGAGPTPVAGPMPGEIH